jgi:hypothetical protein
VQDGDADERNFLSTSGTGLLNGLAITYSMATVVIPFHVVIEFVEKTGLIDYTSELLKSFVGPASGR